MTGCGTQHIVTRTFYKSNTCRKIEWFVNQWPPPPIESINLLITTYLDTKIFSLTFFLLTFYTFLPAQFILFLCLDITSVFHEISHLPDFIMVDDNPSNGWKWFMPDLVPMLESSWFETVQARSHSSAGKYLVGNGSCQISFLCWKVLGWKWLMPDLILTLESLSLKMVPMPDHS